MAKEKKRPTKKSTDSNKSTPPKSNESPPGFEYKRLYRSRKDRMIGGVCRGIADYFSIDPTIVRIIFVVTSFAGGFGVFAYIIGWIVMPEDAAAPRGAVSESRPPLFGIFIGVILVLFGMGMLVDRMSYRFLWMPGWVGNFFSFEFFIALLLIAVGGLFIVHVMRKNDEQDVPAAHVKTGKRALQKSRTNRKLCGVCGGIGEYFDIDPTIVRIVWILLTLFTNIFPGLILYVVMAIVVPDAPIVQKDAT